MIIKWNYIDNFITITSDNVNIIEIENKKYFFRIIKDLYEYNEDGNENMRILSINNEEIKASFKIITNYFDLELNSKNYTNNFYKYINENINDIEKDNILKKINAIRKIYSKILNDSDLPIETNYEFNIEDVTKLMKIKLKQDTNILINLLTLIDLYKIINNKITIIFINLKQYLNSEELIELYKYSIYNNIKIILIDSIHCKNSLTYEKKLYIDSDLEEFVI